MSDIRCSREGVKCDGCPILDKCEHIEVTEEVNPFALYEKGRADAIHEFLESIKTYDDLAYIVGEFGNGNYLLRSSKVDGNYFMPYIHLEDVIKCATSIVTTKGEN